MLLVKVDAIGPKPAQTGLDRPDNACPPANGLVIDIIDAVLGGDHDLVPARAERAADELFRAARADEGVDAVFFRRVDEVDARVERSMDDALSRLLIAFAAEEVRPEVVAAEAYDRHRKLADSALFHSLPPQCVRSDCQTPSSSFSKPMRRASETSRYHRTRSGSLRLCAARQR